MVKRQRSNDDITNLSSSSSEKRPKLEIASSSGTIFVSNAVQLPKVLIESSEEIIQKQKPIETAKNKSEIPINDNNSNPENNNSSDDVSRPQTPVHDNLQSQTENNNNEVSYSKSVKIY